MGTVLDASVSNPLEGGPSYPLSHRLTRLAWTIVWGCLGTWTPRPFYRWRRILTQVFGAQLHATAKIYPGVRIWYPANLVMAAHSTLGPGVDCYCMEVIRLDAYALVSQRATLCGGTHDIDDPTFQLQARPIRIGARAWVAAEAFVGPGVSVGEGAVVGARAVVTKDLEPWTVYVGNPARALRQRRKSPLQKDIENNLVQQTKADQ